MILGQSYDKSEDLL